MDEKASRQRRLRRIAVTSAFVALLIVLAMVGVFWQRSEVALDRTELARQQTEVARQEAVDEARRAEASKLLALARLEIDESPTDAVAYAIASLELIDTPATRQLGTR